MTKQGSLSLLETPEARELLQSQIYARLGYIGADGEPRVIPINFHWDGKEIVLGSHTDGPKVAAIRKNPLVALSIDENGFPPKVLTIRGRASIAIEPNVTKEYAAAMERYMGPEAGKAFVDGLRAQNMPMARIAIEPTWVGLLDFQTRLPHALTGGYG
jgi:pyridoxamine 5'-phosphate oxidase-like protein